MWSTLLIAQAIGWLVLILSSPLIFIFVRKAVLHLSYVILPRDTILQYQSDGQVTEAYYIKHKLFGAASFRKLTQEEIMQLEPAK
ncbi:hypothetical protein BVY11_20310 [Pseudomonas amygdali pv. morsprunorum]|nr:hypothetical protein BKM19_016915 [Pseudomonas amygdali pv. morsprunorum]KWS94839.1 hypothetical protein AL048_22365 [Pseudomonas syringae pv. castaneae]KWS49321.1 hypothetical protein AL056_16725 [Pseudomonas amygdali pv. morsprunorum]KWS59583.1 hypothetical protein AL054_09780 [Pseudomonas amygdali pv. morsprunorum]PHX36310.1 hypothetical protein AO282_26890 [Pseudomonas amygdali pv. morsprunorum]